MQDRRDLVVVHASKQETGLLGPHDNELDLTAGRLVEDVIRAIGS